jgi:sugar phosphate isomerase/epimerase
MNRPRVGVQLIIFGDRAGSDLRGVLADVHAAGYDGFEGGVPVSKEEEAKVAAAVDGLSLAFLGGHSGVDRMENLGDVDQYARHVAALGGRYLMVSGRRDTLDGYRGTAEVLNRAGKRCRKAGVALCYHNHNWEFKQIEGQVPIHLLAELTDPEFVKLCPDVYWIHVGGESPAGFLRRYAARCPCIHFKDGLGGNQYREFRELGRGKVDVPAALDAALKFCEPDWIVVEQDHTDGDPAESCRISRDYLRSLGL